MKQYRVFYENMNNEFCASKIFTDYAEGIDCYTNILAQQKEFVTRDTSTDSAESVWHVLYSGYKE